MIKTKWIVSSNPQGALGPKWANSCEGCLEVKNLGERGIESIPDPSWEICQLHRVSVGETPCCGAEMQ